MTLSWLSKFWIKILTNFTQINHPRNSDKRNVNELFVSFKYGSRRPLLTAVVQKLYENNKLSVLDSDKARNEIKKFSI